MSAARELWIFGYGSLMWRPGFPHIDSRAGFIRGYCRRFWQGSPDHRGTPALPGRVVTLVGAAGARCFGRAYRIAPADVDATLANLDEREQAGYQRLHTTFHPSPDPGDAISGVLVYVAASANPDYLGPAPLEQIAARVSCASGPSGSNRDYALRLVAALAAIGSDDEHVSAVARLVAAT